MVNNEKRLSVIDHFVGLAPKELIMKTTYANLIL